MRKVGDSLKADPARKPPLPRKLKTTHPENFPSQKLIQMPSVKKTLIPFLHWLLPFEIGVPTKSTRVNSAPQKHGKSFAVGQQAQDTGTTLPYAAGWPENVFGKPFLCTNACTNGWGMRYISVPQGGKHFREEKMMMLFISFERRYPGIQESLPADVYFKFHCSHPTSRCPEANRSFSCLTFWYL